MIQVRLLTSCLFVLFFSLLFTPAVALLRHYYYHYKLAVRPLHLRHMNDWCHDSGDHVTSCRVLQRATGEDKESDPFQITTRWMTSGEAWFNSHTHPGSSSPRRLQHLEDLGISNNSTDSQVGETSDFSMEDFVQMRFRGQQLLALGKKRGQISHISQFHTSVEVIRPCHIYQFGPKVRSFIKIILKD